MPIPSEYRNIILSLTERTNEGKLDWKAGKAPSTYFVSFQNFSIALSEVEPGPFTQIVLPSLGSASLVRSYKVLLVNKEGKEIDSFSVERDDKGEDRAAISALWNAARRRVLRVDDALREIESNLQEIGGSDTGDVQLE